MNQKTLLAAGLALACSLSAPVFAADTIIFDPDGTDATNGDFLVGSLDWAPASALALGAIPTAQGSDFELYAHAALQGFSDTDGNPAGAPTGLNVAGSGIEITFITGFTETITSVVNGAVTDTGNDQNGNNILTFDQTITLAAAGTQTVNFFEIWFDDLSDATGQKSDALSGDGYGDGHLILSAGLVSASGNFTATFTFEDVDGSGDFNAGDVLITGLLDQFGTDNWGDQQTVSGEGATQLVADVTFQDTDFFKSDITTLVENLFFNTSNVLPFEETNPSNAFNDGDDGTFGSITPDIGATNGFSGPDILFQADANTSFETAVPEPNTVLLFALGLLFLGFAGRSRYLARS
ncbi:PEP-CTERM sorting domain-containing protein [Marinobacterium aestuariivivens]|uniref:PEP-CTERM sorting domain-containing protein n=1 Tax=Marinobacterium aestuariivivens TaxID=1698799 RepID=A0ABW1ZVC7_9GAMM